MSQHPPLKKYPVVLSSNRQKCGPYTKRELRHYYDEGQLMGTDMVRNREGKWLELEQFLFPPKESVAPYLVFGLGLISLFFSLAHITFLFLSFPILFLGVLMYYLGR